MWTKPWTFKEGFLIGGGLIFAGLMLELSVGLRKFCYDRRFNGYCGTRMSSDQ